MNRSRELKNLNFLFKPRSIAVVGAARETNKIGHILVKNIVDGGYRGAVYPINPHATVIYGRPCFPSVDAAPKTPDLAIVALPAELVVSAVTVAAASGVKRFIILSAGFKEAGLAGVKLEASLIALAHSRGLTILGPNCLGFVNNLTRLNATFGVAPPTVGNLRFITQSGALATSIFDWAAATGVAFSEFITLGNKAIVGENEVLRYWLKVKDGDGFKRSAFAAAGGSLYRPIGMYLESIDAGEEFLELVGALARQDPVFILKPGISAEARFAMRSHTGALAGDDQVLEAALAAVGVIRCHGAEDWFDLARSFSWERAPQGPNMAIVSNAGGPAVMAADAVKAAGLSLAPINQKTRKFLARHLPAAANINDPIDVLGDALADRYAQALDAVLSGSAVDAAVVILTPQVMTQIEATAEAIGALSKKYKKPILCSFMGGTRVAEGEQILNRLKIPSFRYPERAIAALGKMYWWKNWQESATVGSRSPKASRKEIAIKNKDERRKKVAVEKRVALSSLEANDLIRRVGVKTPPTQAVGTFDRAEAFAKQYGYPVALKISSANMLHKTESGGVIVNVTTSEALKEAFKSLSRRKFKSAPIQIQSQIVGGAEVIVGCKRDPSFGPVLLFGAGGILAELMADSNLCLFPIDLAKAQALIQQSKIFPLLNGYRGQRPLAVKKLARLMMRLGALMATSPSILELEINPVIVTAQESWAVDGRVIMKKE